MSVSLSTRASILVVSIMIFIVAALSTLLIRQSNHAFTQLSESSSALIEKSLKEQLQTKGASIIQPLASNLVNPLYQLDMETINRLLQVALKQPGVLAVTVFNEQGEIIHNGTESLPQFGRAIEHDGLIKHINSSAEILIHEHDQQLHLIHPIWIVDHPLGGVEVLLDTREIELQLLANNTRISEVRQQSYMDNFTLMTEAALLISVMGILITIAAVRWFTAPISGLLQFASRLGRGDFSAPPPVTRNDEIGELTRAFAETSKKLNHTTVSRDFLDEIIDTMGEALLIVNTDNQISMANRAACELLGYSERELQHRELLDILVVEEENWSPFNLTHSRLAHRTECHLRNRENHLIPTQITCSIRFQDGEATEILIIAQDITERKKAQALIAHQAQYDALTNLPNRRLLADRLRRDFARAERHHHFGALLYMDLDHFKNINDSLGHTVGDLLLREVSHRLTRDLREEDTVARIGGDEFVVLLSELDDEEQASANRARGVAEQIRESLIEPMIIQGHQLRITPSIGIALFPASEESADDLLKHADTAMYRAKESGRNRVRFFRPSMQKAAEERVQIQEGLSRAIQQQELQLYAQPLTDESGGIVAAEMLLRWLHPQDGLLSPGHFITVAEQSGLILEIGEWVLRQTCEHLAQLNATPDQQRLQHLSVNVSLHQFQRPNFVHVVEKVLAETGAPPEKLMLELTESVLMVDVEDAVEKMDWLKKLGIRFAIDDFGTGYSSLAYLRQLPLDELKIDLSFVQDIGVKPGSEKLVETIINLAHDLDLTVIAEGVELEQQKNFLLQHGCQRFQGYLFGRPRPYSELFKNKVHSLDRWRQS